MGDYNSIISRKEVPTSGGPLFIAGQVTNLTKARYEDWLEGRARRRPFELHKEGELDDEQYKESQRAVQTACAAGTFSWGGEAWQASLVTVPGFVALAAILASDVDSGAREANGGPLEPQDVLDKYLIDEASTKSVGEAVKEVLSVTPNFLSPPVRGMAARSNRNGR